MNFTATYQHSILNSCNRKYLVFSFSVGYFQMHIRLSHKKKCQPYVHGKPIIENSLHPINMQSAL